MSADQQSAVKSYAYLWHSGMHTTLPMSTDGSSRSAALSNVDMLTPAAVISSKLILNPTSKTLCVEYDYIHLKTIQTW